LTGAKHYQLSFNNMKEAKNSAITSDTAICVGVACGKQGVHLSRGLCSRCHSVANKRANAILAEQGIPVDNAIAKGKIWEYFVEQGLAMPKAKAHRKSKTSQFSQAMDKVWIKVTL
jgi:hypothetical protein